MGHIHDDSEYDYTVRGIIVRGEKVLLLFHHKFEQLRWLTLDEMTSQLSLPRKTYSHAEYALKKVKELQK